MKLSNLHEYAQEFEKRLRLKTFPFAVKLLEKEADIPKGAKRPKKDFGYHLAACQGFAMSRRNGVTLAMLKEDMWCFEPVIGYGIAEPPVYFMEGHNRFPEDVATLEAGSHFAQEFPRLESGRYIGVLSAPLATVTFEPDVVLFYCDSMQLNLLLLGMEYRDGYGITCQISSHAACVYAIVPPIQTGKCQIAIPCRGDHYQAMAGDNELIFAAPTDKLADILAGLRHCEEYDTFNLSLLPTNYWMRREPELRESYMKIAKMIGMLK